VQSENGPAAVTGDKSRAIPLLARGTVVHSHGLDGKGREANDPEVRRPAWTGLQWSRGQSRIAV